MNDEVDSLVGQIKLLEKRLAQEIQKKEVEFLYKVRKKKIRFAENAKVQHKKLARRIHVYLQDSRFLIVITWPLIWFCLIPLAALDLVAFVYQGICFPIFGVPKVCRSDYVIMDRHHLKYLNIIERLNCAYCGYANGLLAYLVEMAARTEQYWCPIKHALRMNSIHSRYRKFLDYGDADGYRQRIEEVRRSFEDLSTEPDDE